MISEYSKIIQLERPSNDDAKYFASVMGEVDKRIKDNYSTLQSFTDELAGVDIIKADDKEFYDSKVRDVTNRLNELGTVDLTNIGSVMQAKRALGEITKDKRIINSVTQTKYARRIMDQWDKVRTNPKLAQSWNPINYSNDMDSISGYLNNSDPFSEIGIQNASLYGGENEKLYEAGKQLKESSKDYVQGISKVTIKAKDKNALRGQMDAIPGMARQNKIEYDYYRKQDPNFVNNLMAGLPNEIEYLKKEIESLEITEKASLDSKDADGNIIQGKYYKGLAAEQAGYLKHRLNQLEQIQRLPESQAGLALYEENKKAKHVQTFYTPSEIQGENKAAKTAFEMNLLREKLNLQGKQYNLQVDKFKEEVGQNAIDNSFKAQGLILKELEISGKLKKSVTGTSTGGGGSIGLDPNDYLIDQTFVQEGQGNFLQNKQAESAIFESSYNQSLDALVELLDESSSTSNQYKEKLITSLQQQGIKVDKSNFKSAFTPENLNKISAALDFVESNTGGDGASSFGQLLIQRVSDLSDIKQRKYITDLQLKTANRGLEQKSPEERNRIANKRLEIMGDLRIHGKNINLAMFTKDIDKDYAPIEAAGNSRAQRAPYFVKYENGKKVNYYTGEENPITGGNSEKSKRINIDRTKVIAKELDYANKQLVVQVPVIEGSDEKVRYETMYVPINDSDLKTFRGLIDENLGIYTKSGLDLEDLLFNPRLDKGIVETISKEKFYINGTSLGMPPGSSLTYSMKPLVKNGIMRFTIHTNGKSHEVDRYTSRKEFSSVFAKAYKDLYTSIKSKQGNISDKDAHALAMKYTIEEITK